MTKRNLYPLLVASGVYFFWASTWPVGKLTMSYWTPLGITFSRNLVAGLLLMFIAFMFGYRPNRPSFPELFIGGMQFFLYYMFSYMALKQGAVSNAVAIAGLYPVLVMIWPSSSQLGIGRGIRWVLTAMVVAGVVFLVLGNDSSLALTRGLDLLYAAGAALAMAIAVFQPRRASSLPELCRFTGQSMIIGAVLTGVWLFGTDTTILHDTFGTVAVSQLVYLAVIGSAATFLGFEWLLRKRKAWYVAQGYSLVPALATLMSAGMLGERIGLASIVGIFIITLSLYFTGCLSAKTTQGKP